MMFTVECPQFLETFFIVLYVGTYASTLSQSGITHMIETLPVNIKFKIPL